MAPSSIDEAQTYSASLSPREVRLLAQWEREGRLLLTSAELKETVGKAAADVARNLVRKNVLQRLRRGTFLVRPFRWQGKPHAASSAVAVEALLRGEPHYLGGLWALSFHRLSMQRYDSLIDAFITHRLASRRLGFARIRFHLQPKGAFEYGVAASSLEGILIQVSDRERTVLDALDRPRVFFGVGRAVDLLKERLHELDAERLVAYAIRGSSSSTCQRLGVILERTGMPARRLTALRKKARATRSVLSMNPDLARTGRLNDEWNVVENDA